MTTKYEFKENTFLKLKKQLKNLNNVKTIKGIALTH